MTKRSCEEYANLMDEAFAEELDAQTQEELDGHIQTCEGCRFRWQEYRTLRQAMDQLEASSEPSELAQARIRKAAQERILRMEKKKVPRGWRVLLSQPVVAAATVLVIVGVGIYSQIWMKREKAPDLSPPMAPAEKEIMEDGILDLKEETPAREPVPAPLPAFAPKAIQPKAQPGRLLRQPASEAQPPPTQPLGEVSPPASLPAVAKPVGSERRDKEAPAMGGAGSQRGGGFVSPTTTESKKRKAPADQFMEEGLNRQTKGGELDEKESIVAPKKDQDQELHWESLITQAKAKMGAKDYAGALQDLLEAQKFKDNEELRALISQCRDRIRIVEEGK